MKSDPWNDDTIQFPRLLDEIRAALDPEAYGDHSQLLVDVEESMDLSREQLMELFDRATAEWKRLKGEQEPPPMSLAEALAKTAMELAAARVEARTMRDAALELGRQLERDAILDALGRWHTVDGYPTSDWCRWFADRVLGGSSASAAPGSSDALQAEPDPSSSVPVAPITAAMIPAGVEVLALGQDLMVNERPVATNPVVMFFAHRADVPRLLGPGNYLFRDLRLDDEFPQFRNDAEALYDPLKEAWLDAGRTRAGLTGQEILDTLDAELQARIARGDLALLWFNDKLSIVTPEGFYAWGKDTSE